MKIPEEKLKRFQELQREMHEYSRASGRGENPPHPNVSEEELREMRWWAELALAERFNESLIRQGLPPATVIGRMEDIGNTGEDSKIE